MATVSLLEKPSIYCKEDAAVVIFPSKPYWFSATKEIADILKAFELEESQLIIENMATRLMLSLGEAEQIYEDVKELLYSSGVLYVNGSFDQTQEDAPDYQVNDVENVLVIATTQRCNMSCSMCYANALRALEREMTTDEVKSIINQLAKMPWHNAVSRVALTGGELFTRSDALILIEYVHKMGFSAQVNTNGTLLTPEDIKRLADFPRLKMSISLDGSCAEIHDEIRGAGMFDITVKNIRALCKAGVSVAINMFVHAGNLDDIGATLRLVDTLGVQGFNCLNMMHVGRGNSPAAKKQLIAVPLAKFYRKIFDTIRHSERYQELMLNSTFANQIMGITAGVKSYGCGIGTNRAVYVKADGSLYPCADTAISAFHLGNLLNEDLSDIWENSTILKKLRSLHIDSMNVKCAACDVRYVCAGNCRGENYQTTKDINCPHFKCEEIHDSILEMMWILTEKPDLFVGKITKLYETINSHAASA